MVLVRVVFCLHLNFSSFAPFPRFESLAAFLTLRPQNTSRTQTNQSTTDSIPSLPSARTQTLHHSFNLVFSQPNSPSVVLVLIPYRPYRLHAPSSQLQHLRQKRGTLANSLQELAHHLSVRHCRHHRASCCLVRLVISDRPLRSVLSRAYNASPHLGLLHRPSAHFLLAEAHRAAIPSPHPMHISELLLDG
jgi:hypothetical protein